MFSFQNYRRPDQEETQQLHAAMGPSTARFNQVLRSCGAPELHEFFMDCAHHLPDRFLALTAEAFEYPRSDMKESTQFIGNLMPHAQRKNCMPVWWDSLDDSKPLILVTQGTIANRDLSQSRSALQAITKVADPMTLKDCERAFILQALEECDWVIGGPNGAAARLGIKRTTLYEQIKKVGIKRPVDTRKHR
jgi:hypothetical protein